MSLSPANLNKKNKPLITVYLPTKNRLTLLKRAVSSVLAQTYSNFELIIINDGSTDNNKTLQWLTKLSAQDSRVKVINEQTSKGACAARNKAIEQAKGEYITGLDDDDEFLPNRLNLLIQNYDSKYAFCSHGVLWFYGKKGKVIDADSGILTLNKLLNCNYATNQVFTETFKLRAIKGFDTSFKACQDYDTWTRLIQHFGPAKKLKGYSYIQHQGHEEERISTMKNKVFGYKQYYKKHHLLMTPENKSNQHFMQIIARRERYHFNLYLKQLKSGLFMKKTRYLLSSNFPVLARFRIKALK